MSLLILSFGDAKAIANSMRSTSPLFLSWFMHGEWYGLGREENETRKKVAKGGQQSADCGVKKYEKL